MLMPQRNYTNSEYRYGFNGKETDDEVSGKGNSYDYGFRIYNPRIGKFLSVDPLFKSYPWYTPYQFAGNTPIWAMDLDGLEEYYITEEQYWKIRNKIELSYDKRIEENRSQNIELHREYSVEINARKQAQSWRFNPDGTSKIIYPSDWAVQQANKETAIISEHREELKEFDSKNEKLHSAYIKLLADKEDAIAKIAKKVNIRPTDGSVATGDLDYGNANPEIGVSDKEDPVDVEEEEGTPFIIIKVDSCTKCHEVGKSENDYKLDNTHEYSKESVVKVRRKIPLSK